jgi:hypothetical protein
MASTAIREWRRTLRYRNLLARQTVQMKNKIGMLLMEAGVSYKAGEAWPKRSNHGGRATSDTPQCGFAPVA